MTFATRATGTAERLTRRFGGGATASIRNPGDLIDYNTGDDLVTLAVNGTVAVGGSSLDLDATRARGTLAHGAKFTIAGDATVYTNQADVAASSNALASVSISPVLAAEATDDAVVTITQAYGEWTGYTAARASFGVEDLDGEQIEADDFLLVLSFAGQTFTGITTRMKVQFDGTWYGIKRVSRFEPGTTPAAVRLHCSGLAGA